jgi:hypothetical protein
MDTNEDKLLLRQEVFQIVGSAIEVLNTLGNGLTCVSASSSISSELNLEWERIVL